MNILTIAAGYGMSKPKSGGQNRFLNLIKGLKKNGNEICVLESKKNLDLFDSEIANIFTYRDYRFFNRTLVIFKDFNFDFIWNVYKILKNENIELIQLSHPSGIFVIKILTKIMRKNIPIVYDAHNVESDIIKYVFANNPKYSKLEQLIIPIYIEFLELVCKYIVTQITSVSHEDRMRFIEKYGINGKKVTVIPSGVNIIDLTMLKDKDKIRNELGIDRSKLSIIFHGSYFYPPNREAINLIKNYIAPKIMKIDKDILFIIAGFEVPVFEVGNIKSIGFVEDLYPLIHAADIAILPDRSSGKTRKSGTTRIKALDYIGMGLPMVTTKKGIEGIKAKNCEHAIVVDDVNDEFIDAIKYLIDNKQERERIGANARRLAEEEYDWEKIGKKLDKSYKTILEEIKRQNEV